MPAPTFVGEHESVWNVTTTPKTSSVTVGVGDVLVVVAITEEGNSTLLSTPTGGGLTYTLQQSIVVTTYTAAYIWTAVSASAQTFTLSVARASGTGLWGFNAFQFSGSNGVGASAKTNISSGAPSLGLTTTGANSAVVVVNGDWSAADGTTRTWRTVNVSATEQTYFRDASTYTVYAAYHSDAGAAGAKTVGLSAPTGQKYSIAAMEVLGTSGTSGAVSAATTSAGTVSAARSDSGAVSSGATAASTVSAGRSDTAAVSGSATSTGVVSAARSDSAAASNATVVSASVSAARADTGSVAAPTTGSASVAAARSDAGSVLGGSVAAATVSASASGVAGVTSSSAASASVVAIRTDFTTATSTSSATATVVAGRTDFRSVSASTTATTTVAASAGAGTGFVDQDFATTVSVDSYAAASSVDTLATTLTVDTYSATVTVDALSATATISGR